MRNRARAHGAGTDSMASSDGCRSQHERSRKYRLRVRWVSPIRSLGNRLLARLTQIGADPQDDDDTRASKTFRADLGADPAGLAALGALYLAFGSPVGAVPLVYFAILLDGDRRLLAHEGLRPVPAYRPDRHPVGSDAVDDPAGRLPRVRGGRPVGDSLAAPGARVQRRSNSGSLVRRVPRRIPLLWDRRRAAGGVRRFGPRVVHEHVLALIVMVGGTIVFTLLAVFAAQRRNALAALRDEQARAESLLLNILPASIADKLKARRSRSRTSSARRRSCSPTSWTSPPLGAPTTDRGGRRPRPSVQPLRCARRAPWAREDQDHRRRLHGRGGRSLAPIGTMRTPSRRWRSTCRQRCARSTRSRIWPSCVSGSTRDHVVAGVIGQKRFLRPLGRRREHCESYGVPRDAGRIQITRATKDLLKDEFVCEPRGTIPVKGKGEMERGISSVAERTRPRDAVPIPSRVGHPPSARRDAARRLPRTQRAQPAARSLASLQASRKSRAARFSTATRVNARIPLGVGVDDSKTEDQIPNRWGHGFLVPMLPCLLRALLRQSVLVGLGFFHPPITRLSYGSLPSLPDRERPAPRRRALPGSVRCLVSPKRIMGAHHPF